MSISLIATLDGYSQEFQFTGGINQNTVVEGGYINDIANGTSASLSMLNYYKDTFPYRISLIQETYAINLNDPGGLYGCDRPNNIILKSEIQTVGVVFYPLVLIKSIVEFDFGFQYARTVAAKGNGYYGCNSQDDDYFDLTNSNSDKWLYFNTGGFNSRIALNIPFSKEWEIVPQYTVYYTPLQEAKYFNFNSTLRHFVGLGINREIRFN